MATTVGYYDSYLGLGHNYYLYDDKGQFTIIPWDLNGAFASFRGGMDRESIINFYIDEPTSGPLADRPLIERLLEYEPYLDAYHGYLEEILEGPFAVDYMENRIDELVDLIHPYVYQDEMKFFPNAAFETNLADDLERRELAEKPPPDTVPLPKIPAEALDCIKKNFTFNEIEELSTRRPTPEELDKLKSCLSREQLMEFLKVSDGFEEPQQTTAFIGLKTYVAERSASIVDQLLDQRPSRGDGSGNGGEMFGPKMPQPGSPKGTK